MTLRPSWQHLGLLLVATLLAMLLSCNREQPSRNETASQQTVAPQFQLVPGTTRKVSQVVGEFDFKMGQSTLSRTVTQVNLRGTDGGNSFEYDVSNQEPAPQWSINEGDAVPLFLIEGNGFDFTGGPFWNRVHSPWGGTEPNVFYDDELGLYFAMYTDLFTVRVRTAQQPWGPWTEPVTVFVPWEDYGYGPAFGTFLHRTDLPNRVTLYFLLSTQNPYTVVLMTTTLQPLMQ